MPVDTAFVNIEGPWDHRYVAANGARFHVAEMGDGPLVLLLHGFPQFWFTWRHQMLALAGAGYRVAAMDLRGFGALTNLPAATTPTPRPSIRRASSGPWARSAPS